MRKEEEGIEYQDRKNKNGSIVSWFRGFEDATLSEYSSGDDRAGTKSNVIFIHASAIAVASQTTSLDSRHIQYVCAS